MNLLRVTTVYDDVLWISKTDYASSHRLIPIRCQTGRRWSDLPLGFRPKVILLHRDNIQSVEVTT